jgi:DNA-binding response OmpR family regulator
MAPRDEAATILVVDDDQDVLDLIQFALESKGYEVMTALDGRAALALVATRAPDLILLDLRMPVMDGAAFAAAFRSRHGTAPMVVVTAADDARKRAREIAAADWLAKPFEMADLLDVISRNLPRRTARPSE